MKKEYPLILLLALCFFAKQGSSQVTFQKVYPATVNQSSRDVVPTPDGGYLILGMTERTPTDTDLYVIKTNYTGDTLWTRTYGGSNQEYAYTLLPTNDGNYFMIGYTNSFGSGQFDSYLLKIDPAGNVLWTKTYGTAANEFGKWIIATSDGNYVIAGRTEVSPGNYDASLMKIDAGGNPIWTNNYGGPAYESVHCVVQTNDGGYIFTGQTYSFGPTQGNIYVVKTDGLGSSTWTRAWGGNGMDDGNSVVANSDGTFVVCAETNSVGAGDYDVQAIKGDANGNVIWNYLYGGTDKDVSKTIQATSDGGYVIAAISRSFGWINPDMWLIKLDAQGGTMFTRHYGSWDHEHCYTIKQTSDGGYLVLGHTRSYGPYTEIMFLKVDANGDIAVEEFAAAGQLRVYPNPTEGLLHVALERSATEKIIIRVNNMLGQVLFTEEIDPAANLREKIIDLGDNEAGIYFVSLSTGKSTDTRKIIVR